jgi:DNA-binding NarL/FixJ family response regulator
VAVIEDHPLYRFAIGHVLEREETFALVGVASDADEGLKLVDKEKPDLVLVDLHLPGRDGISLLTELKGRPDAPRVVFLSADGDPGVVARALRQGADGYLVKDIDEGALPKALAAAARGELALPRALQQAVLRELHPPGSLPVLTAREREVLSLTALGRSRREIADRLCVSQATVKAHLGRLYEKLGVHDRAAAVAQAMRLGILDERAGAAAPDGR